MRKCYPAMSHAQGDVVRMRDCILLKSGTRPKDLPFVAKVSALWENADDGEMMMSLLWYYRPEHTEAGRRPPDLDDEIFASKHRDVCSVACIEDKCYVLTFNEYCRYIFFFFLLSFSTSKKQTHQGQVNSQNPCAFNGNYPPATGQVSLKDHQGNCSAIASKLLWKNKGKEVVPRHCIHHIHSSHFSAL